MHFALYQHPAILKWLQFAEFCQKCVEMTKDPVDPRIAFNAIYEKAIREGEEFGFDRLY